MYTVELYAGIRRAIMVEGLIRREAAQRFGVHRNTITKMLHYSALPSYRRRERPVAKKLGPHIAWIDKVLEEARIVIENWREYYNTKRPHSPLDYRPPAPESFTSLRPSALSKPAPRALAAWQIVLS